MKKEVTLFINDMKEINLESGLMALAYNIKNLLMLDNYKNPYDPEMGVGIRDYMFRLLDDGLKAEIRDKILYQIRRYIAPIEGITVDIFDKHDVPIAIQKKNYNDVRFENNPLYVAITIEGLTVESDGKPSSDLFYYEFTPNERKEIEVNLYG